MGTVLILGGSLLTLSLLVFAFYNPAESKTAGRRLSELTSRHAANEPSIERELRKFIIPNASTSRSALARLVPNPVMLGSRLSRTGLAWTVNGYALATAGMVLVPLVGLSLAGISPMTALLVSLGIGLALPHLAVNFLVARRMRLFVQRFPEAIELMVRGLRSGLPIAKTLEVVGTEVTGPVGEEYQSITDKIRIGRTMDEALQQTADRLEIPEFQFFCISIAIQRETGGNLAETLANLSDVLRKRAQMKLKINAMSSEAKASGAIIGALPFVVFYAIYSVNPKYMMAFFTDQRLIYIGIGAFIWMSIGAFVMAKMARFDI